MTLSGLPELVLLKVLCFCSENIEDIQSLRETCNQICRFIDQNWSYMFNIHLVLSNVSSDTIVPWHKPVLNLKLNVLQENYNHKDYDVIQVDSIAACENDNYYIYEDDNGKRLPLIIKPRKLANISKLETLLKDLNLNNLQSLDISFQGVSCFRYPYHVVMLNSQLRSRCLKKMKLDVNFLCGYCTEFVANIQENFLNIELLEIMNIVQRDPSSIDVMICLSLRIFEKFHRDSFMRKTIVQRIPLQVLPDLEESRDEGQFTFKVLPESAQFVTLQFG
eukprot:TRINITY_DN42567_c0_g1_i1.p1 TRINITY_DN42567_c0_g1~~TRINITY_DN42567_c0_g1_i1.p1  ORF type:complete len:277 (+),score=48.36 TRINITY_DN42567_c0_g1_i1:53-883(+)